MITFIRGDWRFFWPENIHTVAHLPYAWDSVLNTGLGTSSLSSLWITSYLNFTALFNNIGLSWNFISIIFWFFPAVFFTFFTSYKLFIYIFPDKKIFGIFAGLIYLFNTYFLLIFIGGQLGVSLAYSIIPFVFLMFFTLLQNLHIKNSIIFGLILSLQILFDPRIVYITLFSLFIFWLFTISLLNSKRQLLYILVFPGSICLLLHSYWVLPLLLTHSSSIPKSLITASGLSFFSFADFSHAFSLLHPNWPENIFGKVYFLQPEFLLFPIFTFSSLLFIQNSKLHDQKQDNARVIILFAIIGLFGAFLAKGVNPPFGQVFSFLFVHVPGFELFRDPTKWYVLIAISYAILIPYSFAMIYENVLQGKYKKIRMNNTYFFILIISFLFLLFYIRPIFSAQNTLFQFKKIPHDYILLKDYLVKEKQFSRTLWIPGWQRYGFFSEIHPAIGRGELLPQASASAQINILQKPETKELIRLAGIKFIIVPFDSGGEIFIKDHRYNPVEYDQTVHALKKLVWLKEVNGFGKIAVFTISNSLDHIFSISLNNVVVPILYKQIHQTEYRIDLSQAKKGEKIIFSETFNPNWVLTNGTVTIHSQPYKKLFNSFIVSENKLHDVTLLYQPQLWVNMGLVISLLTILILICYCFFRMYFLAESAKNDTIKK